jgi:hypothetical protein
VLILGWNLLELSRVEPEGMWNDLWPCCCDVAPSRG